MDISVKMELTNPLFIKVKKFIYFKLYVNKQRL